MSEKGLQVMASKGKFPYLKKVEIESRVYEPCVLGMQKHVTFVKRGKPLKSEKLALIHKDVHGTDTNLITRLLQLLCHLHR